MNIEHSRTWSYPNPRTKDPKEHQLQRILEILPGMFVWATLISMVLFSWLFPVWVAIFIIIYGVYWTYRTFYIASFLLVSFRKMKRWEEVDWLSRLKMIFEENVLEKIKKEIEETKEKLSAGDLEKTEKKRLKRKLIERKDFLERAKEDLENRDEFLEWQKIYHVILLPTAIEEAENIVPAIEAIEKSNYPNDKIIILLAMEEREPEEKRVIKEEELRARFGDKFFAFISTVHKVELGEMKCKSSNATYAAKRLKEFLEEKRIPLEHVILSNFDCDTVMHKEYLSALSYVYTTEPKRLQCAYQPIPTYNNNIWEVITPVRLLMLGCSFWHMVKVMKPEKMSTFSSHSEAFKTIVDTGYWPVNVISEDSLIFWQCFSYFQGDYRVKPIFLPVSMQAVMGNNYWHALKNQYKQKHRWAYGIENFPLIVRAFLKAKKMPFWEKIHRPFMYWEGHYSWATTSFILAFLGWLPLFFGGERFNEMVLAHNLPYITRFLMTLAMTGLVVSMTMSFFLLPPRPKKYTKWKYVPMVLQWIFAPLVALLAAIPAVHAQTRIMLGKYMGSFWVTEKIRKKE